MKILAIVDRRLGWIAAAVVVMALSIVASLDWRSARAQQQPSTETYVPEMRVATSAPVAIATAVSYYNSRAPSSDAALSQPASCDSNASGRHAYVRALAEALPADADEIFKYVHDNVSFSATFGLKKGAAGAVLDGDGTAADQAKLLVELLRARGFCARYVFGTAEATLTQAQTWLGVQDLVTAERVLADGGIPVERTASVVRFAHVWVELYGASGTTKYDPSFKRRAASTNALDLAGAVGLTDGGLRTALGGSGDTNVNRVFASVGGLDTYLATKGQALAKLLHVNELPAGGLPASLQGIDFASKSFEQLLGIGEIIPYGATVVGQGERTPLVYPTQHQNWYEVPDRFKTFVKINIGVKSGQTDVSWQADYSMPLELAANGSLQLRTTFSGSPNYSNPTAGSGRLQLYLDKVLLKETPVLNSDYEGRPWLIAFDVDVPYAASANGVPGAYGDSAFLGRIDPRTISVLIATAGRTSKYRLTEHSRLPVDDAAQQLSRSVWITGSPALNNLTCPYVTEGFSISAGGGGGNSWSSSDGYCVLSFNYTENSLSAFEGGGGACSSGSGGSGGSGGVSWSGSLAFQPCTLSDPAPATVEGTPPSTYLSGERAKGRIALDWLVQASQARVATAALTASTTQAHVVIGLVTSAVEIDEYNNAVASDTLRIHAEALISSNLRADAAAGTQTAARKTTMSVFSSAAAALEGSVMRTTFEHPFDSSVASKFRWSIEFDTSNPNLPANAALQNFRNVNIDPEGRFIRITPAQFAASGSAVWNGTQYYGGIAPILERKLNEGYTLIVPKLGVLGPEMFPSQRRYRPSEYTDAQWYGTVYKNSAAAIILIDPDSGAVSHLVFSPRDGALKGGTAAPELTAATIARPKPEELEAAGDPWTKLSNVDDRDGRLTVNFPADLTVGSGAAGLSFQRSYLSELAAMNRGHNGWTHNHFGYAAVGSGSLAHLGASRPAHAAGMLTAILAGIKLQEASTDIDALVGTQLAMSWWTNQLLFSTVTVGQGTEQTEFYRSPNGEFLAEAPKGGSLKQAGSFVAGRMIKPFSDPQLGGIAGTQSALNSVAISFGYSGVPTGFTYRSPSGVVRRFEFAAGFQPLGKDYDGDIVVGGYIDVPVRAEPCEPQSTYCIIDVGAYETGTQLGQFRLVQARTDCPPGAIDNIALCGGRDFTYTATSVADDLGNTLNFCGTPGCVTASDTFGRSVETTTVARPGPWGGNTQNVATVTAARLKSGTTVVWEQKYSYVNSHPTTVTNELRPLLQKIYLPHDHTNPFLTYAWTAEDRIDSVTRANGKVYNYFATGSRTEIKDPTGASALSYFDENGRLVHAVDRAARLSEYKHDGAGRIIETRLRMKTEPVNVYSDRKTFKSDVYDNVTEVTVYPRTDLGGTPLGSTNIVTKAEFTNVNWPLANTKAIDALDRTVINTYDIFGRLSRADGAQGERTDTVYDSKGFPTSVQTYTSATIYRALDFNYTTGGSHRGLIRQASVYSSAAPSAKLTSSFSWDTVGNLVDVTDPRSNAKAAEYDAARRMTAYREYDGSASAGALKSHQAFVYDLSGRLTQVKRAKDAGATQWAATTAAYSATGRVARIVDPDLDEDNFAYDDRDWLDAATDGEGRVTGYLYDAAGRLTCERRAVGTGLAQAYRSIGFAIFDKPVRLRPAKGSDVACVQSNTSYDTNYSFDIYGRENTTVFADSTSVVSTLNPAGELNTLKTRANQILAHTYDNSSRVLTKTTPQGAYAFTYDREGKRTTASFVPSGGTALTTTYEYDNYGRISAERRHDSRDILFEYDDAGNRTAIRWPDAYRAEYIYDGASRLVEVKAGPSGAVATIARYTYDFMGRRTQLAFGPTVGAPVSSITNTSEDDGDLVRLEHRFNSGATIKVLRHAYDKSGKLKSSAANDTTWAPLPPVPAPDTRTYAANVLDQYTSVTPSGQGATSLTYDQNGNLTGDGTWTFVYDAENRLLTATKTGAMVSYTYDGLGRRQTKTVNGTLTNYLSAGDEEIAEYDASGNLLRRYIPGPGTDVPVAMVTVAGSTNTVRFFHADRQGSIVALADAAGALFEGPFTYDPYGNSADAASGIPFRYTGRRIDPETGLYYYRARYYSPSLARFLQTDPVGYDDQMNLYAYVHNDPANATDPTGLCAGGDGPAACRFSQSKDGPRERAIRAEGERRAGVAAGTGAVIGVAVVVARFSPQLAGAIARVATGSPQAAAVTTATTAVTLEVTTAVNSEGPSGGIIYRGGGTNPSNLIPRASDKGSLSFRSSLSNPMSKDGVPVLKPGEKYFGVDSSKLPPGTVKFDGGTGGHPPGHVSVTGATPAQIKDAIVVKDKFPE